MAKATAICKCEKCGETFTKVKICNSRREANEWERWAESNCTLCPECYSKAKEAEYAATHSIKEMHYSEYKRNYSNCKTVAGSYNSKTKTIKVYVDAIDVEEYTRAANASKSEIFKVAHQMAKALMEDAEGYSYSATFSLCLKYVYAEIKEAKAYFAAHKAA